MKKPIVSFIILALGIVAAKAFLPDREPIRDLEHAKSILEQNGYYCVREPKSGTIIVSVSPIIPDAEYGFEWQYITDWHKGKILLLTSHAISGPTTKSWGTISATGDEALLAKVDELFR